MSAWRMLLAGATMVALGPNFAFADTVSVAGPSVATGGGTVTVSVTLSPDLNNVYALQGGLMYDPAVLTPLPSQETSAPQSLWVGALAPFPGETIPKDADLFRINPSQAGTIVFGYVKNPSNPTGSTSKVVPPTALRITFDVAAAAKGSTALQMAPYTVNGLSMPAILLGDSSGAPINASAGLPLTISFGRPGDVNGDGVVNLDDVSMALQLAGGLTITGAGTPDVRNADVWPTGTRDGAVTLEDASRIMRFVSGLETGLS